MAVREDIRFKVDGDVKLGAWPYLPGSPHSRSPAVTMVHGYAGTREHGTAKFAEAFAAAGFDASCGAALQWFQEHLGR